MNKRKIICIEKKHVLKGSKWTYSVMSFHKISNKKEHSVKMMRFINIISHKKNIGASSMISKNFNISNILLNNLVWCGVGGILNGQIREYKFYTMWACRIFIKCSCELDTTTVKVCDYWIDLCHIILILSHTFHWFCYLISFIKNDYIIWSFWVII